MKVESLEELGTAFAEWRSKKKHAREAIPEELAERARRAAVVHGEGGVARAVDIDRERLRGTRRTSRKRPPAGLAGALPYSRLEVAAPVGGGRPFAELELPSGAKLRLYSQSPEVLGLLSAVCGSGGGR